MTDSRELQSPEGRLGVLLPGMGAIASTFIAGVELYKRKLGDLFGSLTQMQYVRLGKRYERRHRLVRELVPLAEPGDLVFGGWDIFSDSILEVARQAGVLPPERLAAVGEALDAIRPMPGVFDARYLPNLHGTHVKEGGTKMELARQIMDDIEEFRRIHQLERAVMIWCASTE
ncbi:MAG: inositol-3-phosphate synthase, partial [Planctomycetota bacterium]